MQFIFPLMGSSGDYLPLPWGLMDDPDLTGYRDYHAESSGNYRHIIDVRNVVFHPSSWEPHVQALLDFGAPSLAKNYLGKSFAHRHNPPIAQNIPPDLSLKAAMSTSITPLVLLSEFLIMTTLTDKIVYLLFVLCYSLCIFSWLIKKHPDV